MKNEPEKVEEDKPKETGWWAGVKQTASKIWQTVKENPIKSLVAGVALCFPPIGTALGVAAIAGVVGKKAHETYREQNPQKPAVKDAEQAQGQKGVAAAPKEKGLLAGIKQTASKIWQTVKENPIKSLVAGVALCFPPIGTALGMAAIAVVVGKKAHETYKEQNPKSPSMQRLDQLDSKRMAAAKPKEVGLLAGVKQTVSKVWQTVKENPVKSLVAGVALCFPPIGTVLGAIAIAGVVGKKAHETYKEQEATKAGAQESVRRNSNAPGLVDNPDLAKQKVKEVVVPTVNTSVHRQASEIPNGARGVPTISQPVGKPQILPPQPVAHVNLNVQRRTSEIVHGLQSGTPAIKQPSVAKPPALPPRPHQRHGSDQGMGGV